MNVSIITYIYIYKFNTGTHKNKLTSAIIIKILMQPPHTDYILQQNNLTFVRSHVELDPCMQISNLGTLSTPVITYPLNHDLETRFRPGVTVS